ncbi:MAG TPA: PIN domain-containing protein [Blastocatellia bacterium]|nr:PIN domain-containing protein [Blastocatellia bacterium]
MSTSILASEFVTDTMGLVLRIERRKMGSNTVSIFDSVESGNTVIYIPTLVFAEILYLSEKSRISASLSSVASYLKQYPNYKESPMSLSVVEAAEQITDIRELHDRLIAGTARSLDRELITNDPVIQASIFVKTIW